MKFRDGVRELSCFGLVYSHFMVANGVAGSRIETVSYGEERPVAYGSGESNWAQNRRVELK